MRSLNEWLYDLENRSQQDIQLGLTRIRTVAERLDLLPVCVPVITVGGTNGKGSTVATLESIYFEAGYRVGVYTSPHLVYFNERIRLNKQNISDEDLCQAFALIDKARETIHLTYFEMATLAALWHFKSMQSEVLILEVGMGGRLDATNIVDANLAIITTIDYDHEAYLGHTLEAIGFEKAGILRPNQTLIYSDIKMPNSIAQQADDLKVTSWCFDKHFSYELIEDQFIVSCPTGEVLVLPKPNIHLNAATSAVVAAVSCLNVALPVERIALERSMQTVFLSGRIEVFYDTICTVLDVSHNPQSVGLLADRLKLLVKEKAIKKVHAVFSGLKDKDLSGLIKPMEPLVDEWYTAVLDNKRAATDSMIKFVFEDVAGVAPHFYGSIEEAYHAAMLRAKPGDAVVVYGSFFVVSPIILERGVL